MDLFAICKNLSKMDQTCPDLICIQKKKEKLDPQTPQKNYKSKTKKKASANKTRFPAPCNSSLPLHTGGYGGKTFGTFNEINQILFGSADV